jgi:hypothetical protein
MNITLEGSVMEIVNMLWMEWQLSSWYKQLIDGANMILKGLQSLNVGYVKREANVAAYKLVKVAIQQSLEQNWVEDYSTFINDIVSVENVTILWF